MLGVLKACASYDNGVRNHLSLDNCYLANAFFSAAAASATPVTYTAAVRPDGSVYGEAQGLVAGKGGERATFKAQGVGRILDGGGVSYRGAQYFYSDSPKFSGLNRIAVVFEYEADAEGNTKSKLFEWK